MRESVTIWHIPRLVSIYLAIISWVWGIITLILAPPSEPILSPLVFYLIPAISLTGTFLFGVIGIRGGFKLPVSILVAGAATIAVAVELSVNGVGALAILVVVGTVTWVALRAYESAAGIEFKNRMAA